jgi:hypothetical protein
VTATTATGITATAGGFRIGETGTSAAKSTINIGSISDGVTATSPVSKCFTYDSVRRGIRAIGEEATTATTSIGRVVDVGLATVSRRTAIAHISMSG